MKKLLIVFLFSIYAMSGLRSQDISGNYELDSLVVTYITVARDTVQTVDTQPGQTFVCLLYTSPSPRDRTRSRMPSSA